MTGRMLDLAFGINNSLVCRVDNNSSGSGSSSSNSGGYRRDFTRCLRFNFNARHLSTQMKARDV